MSDRRILVPHAVNRPALTVIRSLGSKGLEVFAGAPGRVSLGGISRYAADTVIHPNPAQDSAGFANAVAQGIAANRIRVVMPAGDVAANALLAATDRLPPGTRLIVPPGDALARAHDKISLVELARGLDVPVPRSVVPQGNPARDPRVAQLGYPLILKPRCSCYLVDNRWLSAGVKVVSSPNELRECLDGGRWVPECGYMIQEKVPGEGRGVFALAKDGRLQCVFAHRRIREKPPGGGVSTLCESADPEPSLVEYSRRLLGALKWSGVAMVEFKWDPERRIGWLMEINGRFWGSMQLAVSSGVDFPWLLYRQEVLEETLPPAGTIRGSRLWWVPGDLDHFLIRLSQNGARELPSMLADLLRTRSGHHLDLDTLKIRDPLPFLYEMRDWVVSALGVGGRSRRPRRG